MAQKLERAEAENAAAFIDARGGEACWERIGGAWALFDGPGSPLTQAFGLGLFEPASAAIVERIERFFEVRAAAVDLEVSPLAGVGTYALLARRGYTPVELSTVLYRPRSETPEWTGAITVGIAGPKDYDTWARVSADGWMSEAPEYKDFFLDLGRVSARRAGSTAWLAYLDGHAVAAASLSIHGPAAHMAGASTVPAARGRGAQNALLAARLRHAWAQGCEMAVMGTAPGSASQRNAERNGFLVAYTRTKWRKE